MPPSTNNTAVTDDAGGRIILLNGASSAGKSTLCRAIQAQIDEPFLQFSLDFFFYHKGVLPPRRDPDGPFAWPTMRPHVLDGYYRCLAALLAAGNNLVVDLLLETRPQFDRVRELLAPFDVFFVGVHCPLPELERRERERGDRRPGDARNDFATVHTFSRYDFEVDSTRPAEENAVAVIAAWKERTGTSVLGAKAAGQPRL